MLSLGFLVVGGGSGGGNGGPEEACELGAHLHLR